MQYFIQLSTQYAVTYEQQITTVITFTFEIELKDFSRSRAVTDAKQLVINKTETATSPCPYVVSCYWSITITAL